MIKQILQNVKLKIKGKKEIEPGIELKPIPNPRPIKEEPKPVPKDPTKVDR